jgi:hypothetical protein
MSNVLLKGVRLNQPVILRRTNFFDAGSRAICLTESEDSENFMFLIKNEMAAGQDGFFILGREELDFFDKTPFHNFFNDEFKGLDVVSNKYYACSDGSLDVNEPYTLYFTYNGKYVGKWTIDSEDDQMKINKVYIDENFKSEFEFFMMKKDREAKELFYKNAINLKWDLDKEELEKSFCNYISDYSYGLRTFEEQITHEYIRLNKLNPGILRRFDFRDELIKDNLPFTDLQTGIMFKVLDTVELEKNKILKKGDFYQIVKKWNSEYFLELLNIDDDLAYNGKSRALVLSCDKEMLKENFRNVLSIEKEALYHSNVIKGLGVGEEVEFKYDLLKKVRGAEPINIKSGMKGIVLESDYKIRLAIKDEKTSEILYRDFYRSEVLKVTNVKDEVREWMVTPQKINSDQQCVWGINKEISGSKLYHNGRFIAELDKNDRLNFHNELLEKEYQKLKKNLFADFNVEINKLKEKEVDLIMMHHLINLPDINKSISEDSFNNYIKIVKGNNKSLKYN